MRLPSLIAAAGSGVLAVVLQNVEPRLRFSYRRSHFSYGHGSRVVLYNEVPRLPTPAARATALPACTPSHRIGPRRLRMSAGTLVVGVSHFSYGHANAKMLEQQFVEDAVLTEPPPRL